MDLDDSHTMGLFLEIYGTLPRAGPGGDEHTTRALGFLPGPSPSAVLDLGCGPGAQTLSLARELPDAQILAVDLLPAMVDEAERRFTKAHLDHRVTARVGDIAEPHVAPGSQDLIWCEGAIYFLGTTEALGKWGPLLATGGTIAFTLPIWLVESPPEEVEAWWLSEYPDLTDDEGIRSRIEAASYRTIASFLLPPSAWWDEYYEPMELRIEALRAQRPNDPAAIEIITGAEKEIDIYRRFSDTYSYAFYLVQESD